MTEYSNLMKKQIILIHGGDTADSYREYLTNLKRANFDFQRLREERWKDSLGKKLGKSFEVIAPKMPNQQNAKYLEWKIWFEKLIPHFEPKVILVGHSLGGIFLAKYLAENKFPKEVIATYLIAAPYDDKNSDYTLADFVLPKKLKHLTDQGGQIFLFYSEDDPVVALTESQKYLEKLPKTKLKVFSNRGHFSQKEFPELIREIKKSFK